MSINLEDAIATAEEINKQQLGYSDGDDEEEQEYSDAQEIAGIVTDGHNQKDGFDEMREEQLQQQRMGQPDYGNESGYDEEDDVGQSEDKLGDDEQALEMQLHPDLIAAAHKMGVELDSD